MFEIRIDPVRCIVRLRFEGLLTTAHARDYVRQMRDRFAVDIAGRPYRLLIDAVASRLQTQETMGILMKHIAETPGAARIAIVTGASPTTMQLRRALAPGKTRFFMDMAEAEDWLVDGWHPPRRAA